jgi:uncharacterized protein
MAPKRQEVILLVDGYNVIGAWKDLYPNEETPLQQSSGEELEVARNRLIEQLINFSSFEGYFTTVVFDAHNRDTPAVNEILTPNVSTYYTEYKETADTYIEKFCAGHRTDTRLKTRVLVATSDRAQQLTVGGYGAEWISALQLVNNIESSSRKSRDAAFGKKKQPKGNGTGRLFNSLDAESQAKLSAMVHGSTPVIDKKKHKKGQNQLPQAKPQTISSTAVNTQTPEIAQKQPEKADHQSGKTPDAKSPAMPAVIAPLAPTAIGNGQTLEITRRKRTRSSAFNNLDAESQALLAAMLQGKSPEK